MAESDRPVKNANRMAPHPIKKDCNDTSALQHISRVKREIRETGWRYTESTNCEVILPHIIIRWEHWNLLPFHTSRNQYVDLMNYKNNKIVFEIHRVCVPWLWYGFHRDILDNLKIRRQYVIVSKDRDGSCWYWMRDIWVGYQLKNEEWKRWSFVPLIFWVYLLFTFAK
jgi:hypothetical protein